MALIKPDPVAVAALREAANVGTADPDQSRTIFDIIHPGIFQHPMQFFCVEIDDDMAVALLQHNRPPAAGKRATNRRLSKVRVKFYADQIRQDLWRLSPQALVFANNGDAEEMIDGQHRLLAFRVVAREKPGLTVPFVVCIGADHPAMMVIDRGNSRKLSDDVSMSGRANAPTLASALKMLVCYDHVPFISIADWEKVKISPLEWEDKLLQYPNLEQALVETREARGIIQHQVVATLWTLIARGHDIYVAAEFVSGLAKGQNMDGGDPRYKLREFLVRQQRLASKYKWTQFELFGTVVLTFNAWLTQDATFRPSQARDEVNRGSQRVNNPTFPRLRGKLTEAELLLQL